MYELYLKANQCKYIMRHSHYRLYVLRLKFFRGGRTTSEDASYLPRFGVAFTIQAVYFMIIGVWWNALVLQLLYKVHMWPCDTVAKHPSTSTRLMPLYYTVHNRVTTLYTLLTTPSFTVAKNSLIRLRVPTVPNSEVEILKIVTLL